MRRQIYFIEYFLYTDLTIGIPRASIVQLIISTLDTLNHTRVARCENIGIRHVHVYIGIGRHYHFTYIDRSFIIDDVDGKI